MDTGQRDKTVTEVQDTGWLQESTRAVHDAGQLYEVWDTGQLYKSTSEVQDGEQLYEVWDTGQLYKSTGEVQGAEQMYEVLDPGQQYVSLMIENASTDSKLEDNFAFFGWCRRSLGTNADVDTPGWRVHTD